MRRGPPAVPIRPARPADVENLLRLENEAFPGDRLERRAFRHAVRSPSIVSLVAADGEALLGYVLVETRRGARVGRLTSVATGPAARGRGLGRSLVEAAEGAARARGCDRLRLEVRRDNARAIALYEGLGFVPVGETEDYYEDGEAARRFEKRLG